MAKQQGATMLKVVLVIYAVVELIYGLVMLFIPGVLAETAEAYSWIRWPGGFKIALAIGALLVMRKPAKQGIFVTTIALAASIAGLAMVYSWIAHEYSGPTGPLAVSTIIILILAVLLWWSRMRARKIL